MLDNDKIQMVIDLLGDDSEDVSNSTVIAKLAEAKASIMQRIWINYSNIPDGSEMPGIYDMLQCRLAVRYINRMGAEGEISHDANSTHRTYSSTNDEELLREVTQIAGF